MDFVGLPVYSWGCAAGHAIRMASRITGRREVLVPASIDPERLAVIRTYCEPREMAEPHRRRRSSTTTRRTGRLDLADLERKLSDRTAAVYFENPSYLGTDRGRGRRDRPRSPTTAGAEAIVGVDPISLGVLAPPGDYGADIVVGTTQPLGVHMSCGGGVGGFIATRDEERYAREYPTLTSSASATRSTPASAASASRSSTRPRTARARRARTGPATRSTSGRSRTPLHVAARAARLRGARAS